MKRHVIMFIYRPVMLIFIVWSMVPELLFNDNSARWLFWMSGIRFLLYGIDFVVSISLSRSTKGCSSGVMLFADLVLILPLSILCVMKVAGREQYLGGAYYWLIGLRIAMDVCLIAGRIITFISSD